MGDLQKFIRQHFFDNNWTRDVDLSSISDVRLSSLDSAFSNIDVKSKLCILLAFSHTKPANIFNIDKHVESIFLQALDEENNLVKAVATILHSKQSLNYLNFDISPTNEAFSNNLTKLLKLSTDWDLLETPILAEYLGDCVLKSSYTTLPTSAVNKDSVRKLGFRCRDKPFSVKLKETYLDRLKEECQRRRVHVPIPGRSFGRSEDTDDVTDLDSSGFIGSQNSTRRSDLKRTMDTPSPLRRTIDRKPSTLVNPNPNLSERSHERPFSKLHEKLTSRSPAASNLKKSTGIKMLDFDELPAFGPKAKQLRKEQMEKEREAKRQEREVQAKLSKMARESAKLSKQAEKQAVLMESRQRPIPVADSIIPNVSNPAVLSTIPMASRMPNDPNQNLPISGREPSMPYAPSLMTAYRLPVSSTMSYHQYTANSAKPALTRLHPLLSSSVGMSVVSGVTEDDEDDDDDDTDDLMMHASRPGVYNLGIPQNFRGFNSTLSENPSKAQFQFTSNTSAIPTTTPNHVYASVDPQQILHYPTQFTHAQLNPTTPYSSITAVRNINGTPNVQYVGSETTTEQPGMPRMIKITPGAPNATRVIRIVRPSQPMDCSFTARVPNPPPVYTIPGNTTTTIQTPPTSTINAVVPNQVQGISRPRTVVVSSALPMDSPINIAPRPRIVQLVAQRPSSIIDTHNPLEHSQQQLINIQPSPVSQRVSLNPQPQIMQQRLPSMVDPVNPNLQTTQARGDSSQVVNATWMIGGRPVMLAPMTDISESTHQGSQTIIRMASPPTGIQPQSSTGFMQILRQPNTGVLNTSGQTVYTLVQPNSASLTPFQSLQTSTAGQPFFERPILHPQQQRQSQPSTTTSLLSVVPPVQSSSVVVGSHQASTVGLVLSNELNDANSGVQLQDDLRLTEAQLSSVQKLFLGANRVSRPEKAMIVSFIAGARGNPQPESGNPLRIRLSEYRERLMNQSTGQMVDVVADTYLHLDYTTGKCEKVKYYRNEPPEVLLSLPVQPSMN